MVNQAIKEKALKEVKRQEQVAKAKRKARAKS
jgi:hypothetical protein